MSQLGCVAAHELAPRGHVEKQIAYFDGRTRRVRARTDFGDGAAIDLDLRGVRRACWMGGHAQARNGADRRHRLAAEAQSCDGLQVVQRCDFARRMPGDRDRQLLRGNSAAIIAHADQTNATALDIDLDAVCAGVQAVFNQLLDDGGGTLDDLACGDLVDELAGEDTDGHRRESDVSSGRRGEAQPQR